MSKEDNKQKIQDTALAGASLGALGTSKNMILGKKKMYHGTSKENREKTANQVHHELMIEKMAIRG